MAARSTLTDHSQEDKELQDQLDSCIQVQAKSLDNRHSVKQMTQTSICRSLNEFFVNISLFLCPSTEVRNSNFLTHNH